MASSYLNLYQGAGGLRQRGAMGSSSAYNPGGFQIGTPQGLYWQAGNTQKVVHDQYNNMYYGTQKQSELTKGLTDSIARLQAELDKGGSNSWQQGWMGHGGSMQFNKFDSKAIADQNARIASQQQYLDNINNGMYKQESSTFFDSYDDWTGDWNNVFARRKSNSDTLRRNDKISEENAVRDRKAKEENTKAATGSQARAKKLTPNLEIGTGVSAQADKLAKSLGTGLGKSINSTGLGI
jgi:hypothetical protein